MAFFSKRFPGFMYHVEKVCRPVNFSISTSGPILCIVDSLSINIKTIFFIESDTWLTIISLMKGVKHKCAVFNIP